MRLPNNYAEMGTSQLRELVLKEENITLPEGLHLSIEYEYTGSGYSYRRSISNASIKISFTDFEYKTIWRKISFKNGELDSEKLKAKIGELTKLLKASNELREQRENSQKEEKEFFNSLPVIENVSVSGTQDMGYSVKIRLQTRGDLINIMEKLK